MAPRFEGDEQDGGSGSGTLAARLRTGQPMPWRLVVTWTIELAGALEAVHRTGVAHGSITPDAVRFDEHGTTRLADIDQRPAPAESPSKDDLPYLAPEVLAGERPGRPADVYALAAVAYAAVRGHPAFIAPDDETMVAALSRILTEPPEPPGEDVLPAPVWAVLDRGLSKDPKARYASAADLGGALQDAQRALDEPVTPMAIPDVAPDPLPMPAAPFRDPAPEPQRVDDDVQFTVYRPKAVQPDRAYRLLAFIHKTEFAPDAPDPVEEVKRRAAAALGQEAARYRPINQDATSSFHHGEEVVLVPEMDGVRFHPPVRNFRWLRAVHQEEFDLEVDADRVGTTVTGRMTVFLSSVPIAEVPLRFPVVADDPAAGAPPDQVESARRYRRIFPSYSHKDSEIVDQIGSYIASTGDEFMRDVKHLRAGQAWSEEIRSMIRQSEVFALYWSWNSMVSPHVRSEWEYALSIGKFITPVYWDDPRPEDPAQQLPPPELDRLHFARVPLVATPPAPVAAFAPPAVAPAAPAAIAAPPVAAPPMSAAPTSRKRIGLLAAVPAGAIALAVAVSSLSGGGGGQVASPPASSTTAVDFSEDFPAEELVGSIAIGENSTGFIESGGADVHEIEGTGGDVVIRVLGTDEQGGLDPTVTVRDSGGTEVGFDDDSGNRPRDSRLELFLEAGESYEIVVAGYEDSEGVYELRVD